MILRNRSLYVDDIFHVISSFLVTKDYPTAYKLMLYAVKQVIIPPPHIFCTLCVTIGTSPILNEKALNIAEKTFQLMLKLYGSCIVYSSYWSSPQDGCLLTSRIQWLMKSKKYDEIKIHLLDCENHIQDTPQRLIDLCEIALTLVPKQVSSPSPTPLFPTPALPLTHILPLTTCLLLPLLQEIDLRQDIQQILFRGKDMLHQATLQTSPPSAQLSVESSSLSSRLQNGNEYTPRR